MQISVKLDGELPRMFYFPIVLHALEVCQLPRRDMQLLDFIVDIFYEIVSNN